MITVTAKSDYIQDKIKGNQRLGPKRPRIAPRFKILFYVLTTRGAFNDAFCSSSLKRVTVKGFKPE